MIFMELMHRLYRKDKVTNDIAGIIDKLYNNIVKEINDIKSQGLLTTATWYLSQKEKELNINNNSSDINVRRARVLSRMTASGKCSIELIKDIVGRLGINASISIDKLVLTIELRDANSNELINFAKTEIDAVVPAHIVINYVNYKRTYNELAGYTYGELTKYTYNQLKEGIIDDKN